MSKAVEVDELLDLFDMMWRDALGLLTDLSEGITAFAYSAGLHFITGVLLLLMAATFVAMGRVAISDVVSLLLLFGILGVSCLILYFGIGLWKRFKHLQNKYSGMMSAARKFKQQGKMA